MGNQTLKIENARYILTIDPLRRIIEDGSILIDGPKIVRVGKASELRHLPANRVIDAREMVVTPGFVNGHIHISYAHVTRGIFPDDLGPDYFPNVFKLQSLLTEEEEYYASLLAITELLKYGTTCFLDPGTTKYLDACMQAYEESGCRIVVGRHAIDRPGRLPVPVYSTMQAVGLMEETLKRYDGKLDGRLRAWVTPQSMESCSRELLVEAKRLADEYGTGMTLHQTNTTQEVEESLRRHGKRPVQYLEEIGILGPNVVLAHAIGLDEGEIDSLVRTGAKVVVCATAALKQGLGMTRVGTLPEMLTRGVEVGLGTDSGNNSNLIDTMRSMYLVAVLYKDARQSTGVINAETALEMATIRGARVLGLADRIGSIEVDKRADLVLFDTRRPEWRTLFNPVNNLVYSADGRSVHTVIVDGRVVVQEYRTLFVDESKLVQRVQELGEGILARTGVSFPPRWPVV